MDIYILIKKLLLRFSVHLSTLLWKTKKSRNPSGYSALCSELFIWLFLVIGFSSVFLFSIPIYIWFSYNLLYIGVLILYFLFKTESIFSITSSGEIFFIHAKSPLAQGLLP